MAEHGGTAGRKLSRWVAAGPGAALAAVLVCLWAGPVPAVTAAHLTPLAHATFATPPTHAAFATPPALIALATPPASAVPAGTPTGRAPTRWRVPLVPNPAVLRGFAPPAQRWLAGHRGVDLAAAAGQPVHSAGAGTVVHAGHVVDRGVVVVEHGDLRTSYEPIDAVVRRGDMVGQGTVLGTVGAISSHCPTTSCLHWGLRRGQIYLNPMLLLRPGPVRLLPVWARVGGG
jgi:murein DD-endopeptidase MepM/ murein hydrolase activator NlpD